MIAQLELTQYLLVDDGTFPNNGSLPALHYKDVFEFPTIDPASVSKKILKENNWKSSWQNGIYTYHHYHSTAHKALVICEGFVKMMLGGPFGVTVQLDKGDMLVIPAGVAHKNMGCSLNFKCFGACPAGQRFDINYGFITDRPGADMNIEKVRFPKADPLFGADGPLFDFWKLPVLF